MMNPIDLIKERRSIRSFIDKKISNENMQIILECAMSATTARNQQGFRFVIVNNKSILKRLSDELQYGKMLKDADQAVAVCYDVSDEFGEYYYKEDASAVTQNILLSSSALGIGSVWIAIQPKQEKIELLTKMFQLPKDIVPVSLIALGYSDKPMHKKADRFD
jgi:nitroreductase